MTTSKKSKTNNEIFDLICSQNDLFDSFEYVYLFGSSIKTSYPNDVDILLIYLEYSNTMGNKIKEISERLRQICKLPIHITALSVQEVKETQFLKKIVLYQILK